MELMQREEFLKLNIKDQVEYVNSRTITGLKVIDVAKELNIGDKGLRTRITKQGYVFDRKDKIYILGGQANKSHNEAITKGINDSNNTGIIKETAKQEYRHNTGITKEEKLKKHLFSDEEIKGIRKLLAVKEQLLQLAITPSNNNDVTVMDILNIDRTNRKKATFNLDIELLEELDKYNNNPNISKSDIVNEAIKEYLERNNKVITKK